MGKASVLNLYWSLDVGNDTLGGQAYSRRYARVRVLRDEAEARSYLKHAFPHVGRVVALVERDGTYLYRADAEGFACGSPRAGWGVGETEVRDGGETVQRNHATANMSDKMRRFA